MIQKLSSRLLGFLVDSGTVSSSPEETEFYQYGIEITISSFLNVALILILGAVYGTFAESILFLVLFIPIRQFTGGFHAHSYFSCNFLFCLCFSALIAVHKLTYAYVTLTAAAVICPLCILVITLFCPVENPNKIIPQEKRPFHKIVSVSFAAVYSILAAFMIHFGLRFATIVLYTLMLVTVLIIIPAAERRCFHEKG